RVGDIFPSLAALIAGRPPVEALFGAAPESFGLLADWLRRGPDGFLLEVAAERVAQLEGGGWVHVSAATSEGGGLVLCWSDITEFKQAEAVLASELA
ncbi:hypothetical protein ACE4Z5_24805, partial [Salmonella enterica]|uniref:hypothetical protein n=1 Tax=Salmonella enterica TaxID=28901 RepID=UPI003D294938